jgi:hypothetical protein
MTLLRGALLLSGVRPFPPIARVGVRSPTFNLMQIFTTAGRSLGMRAHVFIARRQEAVRSLGEQT